MNNSDAHHYFKHCYCYHRTRLLKHEAQILHMEKTFSIGTVNNRPRQLLRLQCRESHPSMRTANLLCIVARLVSFRAGARSHGGVLLECG